MPRPRKTKTDVRSILWEEFFGVALIALSLIALMRAGWIGDKLYVLCASLFGVFGVGVPLIVIVYALDRFVVRQRLMCRVPARWVWGVVGIAVAIMLHVQRQWLDERVVDGWRAVLYASWVDRTEGGGLVGALIAVAVTLAIGDVGGYVFEGVLLVGALLLLTGQSLSVLVRTCAVRLVQLLGHARRTERVPKVAPRSSPVPPPLPMDEPMDTEIVIPITAYEPELPPRTAHEEAHRPLEEVGAWPTDQAYVLPSSELLTRSTQAKLSASTDIARDHARKLEATLDSFGVKVRVLQVVQGPSVTRFELQPDVGVKVSRIVSLQDDIALALAAKDIRMEAPIPGKSAIGIEVPNQEVAVVTLREVIESVAFVDASAKLTIALGRDIAGAPIVANLSKMPHLLVAGATGSGKSVCINGMIASMLYKATPQDVRFLMIDPKMVELNVYNGIPHLLAPVVTDAKRAALALKKIVVEMEKRYTLFSQTNTRNIEGYNALQQGEHVLPWIVVIVDELADLMMVAAGDVEDAICRLAQMARAAGIHLIIATQRPSVDVITGVIKANIPSRIAFGVSSQIDSRTILDMAGAEKLLGRGDMLYVPIGASKAQRIQGAYVSDQEVEALVAHCARQAQAQFVADIVPEHSATQAHDAPRDALFDQAARTIIEAKQASASLLQRKLRVGYARAARLIDELEAHSVIGRADGAKPRDVLMTLESFEQSQQ
jgi:DNA segregation ATPase FtsK/SpoIIIE-like protein